MSRVLEHKKDRWIACRKVWRAFRLKTAVAVSVALASALSGGATWLPAAHAETVSSGVAAVEAQGDIFFDFENFALGPLNGQQGWTNAGPEVTVTDEVYAVSGSKTVKIWDNDPARAMGARYAFPPIVRGSVEWWVNSETYSRLVALLESTGPDGTKNVEWIGLLANGKIEYYDGNARLNTVETYEPGKWYRFRVEFDATTHRKSIYVFDGGNLLLWKKDTAFRDETVSSVNMFRFATISTNVGTFYVDDVRIRDADIAPPGILTSLQFHPERLTLSVGATSPLALFGNYTSGEFRPIEQAAFVSANPYIAAVEQNTVQGVSPGDTVITATYGPLRADLPVRVIDPNEVPPYIDLTPRTIEGTTDVYGITIVAPDEDGWRELGERIADELNSRWNAGATVVAPDPDKFSGGWSGNTLILGSLGNNAQMARLYGLRMSYADAVYPGSGGYQLLTLVDPFGRGGNTVLVGASDLAGATLGVDRLMEILDEQSAPAIPWLAEAKLSAQTASYFPYGANPTEANIRSALAAADQALAKLVPSPGNEADSDALLYVFGRVQLWGEYYQLTGHPGFGEVYKRWLKGYANFLNRYPNEAKAQLNARENMWTAGDALIENWTVMEASPLFTPFERSQIVSALYLTYEANSRDGYLASAAPTGPRWNHEIFPALSLVVGSDYFRRYHQLPEAEQWHALGERIFTGNTANISLDEGSDYLMHVPMTNIDYAMATGNLEFISRSLRPSADLNALMIDNLGTMAGGGDTYPFGYSNAYSWGHSQVMNAASWFYGDPLYLFLLERTRTGPFPGQRMSDLQYPIHRYMAAEGGSIELPEDAYPKVQAYPVEQGVYDDLRGSQQAPLDVDLADTFHKLTFRQGFGVDDSYLIVDGFSAGSHGHQDGNAVIGYSANGRLFLTDRDYIENTPEHHSGLVVVKDGEQPAKPPLARLQWAGDFDGIGISRSQVPNYNGTDWDRSIVSLDGEIYLIYDDVKFNESGNFLLKNLWQALGAAEVRGDRFEVEQQGVAMTLQSLDASDLRTQERYGHFIKYWKKVYPYPYADKETVLQEVIAENRYEAGERVGFINVLSSGKGNEPRVQARRLSETTVEIHKGPDRWLAVQGPLDGNVLKSDGAFHLLSGDRLLAAGATTLSIGTQSLQFPEPVMFVLDVTSGAWKTYSLRKGLIRYDSEGTPIREDAIGTGTVPWNRMMQQRLEREISDREHPGQWKKPHPPHPGPQRDWRKIYDFHAEVTSTALGDLDGDGVEELVLGGSDGTVQAVGETGSVLWTFAAAGRVNEVTVQTLDGQPIVFVATENWVVHALDAQGREKWNRIFPSDSEHSEQKGNLLGVTNVRVAYVNGADQEPWIMVGTQFRYIYGLDRDGNLKYEEALCYYGIEDMEFADLDGDGKEEGMLGMEYSNYIYWKNKQSTRAGSGQGPGWKTVDALREWSGDALPAVILGTKQNEVRLVQAKGSLQERWSRNVGGEVNDIRHGDFNGDGATEILVGTDGFQFYLLNADGTVRFRRTLDDRVLKVGGWMRGGEARYLAAADHGLLYELTGAGEIGKTVRFAHPIVGIPVGDGGTRPWVILQNGEVYVSRGY